MDECYFKTAYRCDSYKNILEYARSYKWPTERRKDRGFQSIKFPSTLMDNDPHSSLMDVKMLSDTEAWAAGGHPESGDFEGRFFHSLDGGNTWTKESIKGMYIVSLDMLTTKSGYAVSLTQSQPAGIKLFKYTPSKK